MLFVVLMTIILNPILPYVWRLLAIAGSIIFGIVFCSWLVHVWFPPKFQQFPTKTIASLGDVRQNRLKLHIPIEKERETPIVLNLKQFFKDLVNSQFGLLPKSKVIVDMLKTPGLGHKYDKELSANASILDSTLATLSTQTVGMLHSIKMQNLFESWSIMVLETIKHHVIRYKKLRAEIQMSGSAPALLQSNIHLDEFNEYTAESEDESLKWSSRLDNLNDQVILRMRLNSELHPAVGQGHEAEIDYLRLKISELIDLVQFQDISLMNTSIFKVFMREWIYARAVWPAVSIASNPNTINNILIEKSNKRLVFLRSVKYFKAQLDLYFSNFPPIFLIANNRRNSFTVSEKQRYIDEIEKYLRKATSEIDILALKCGVLSEIRKKSTEIGSLRNEDERDDLKKYLSSLKGVLRRIDKREKFLANKKKNHFASVVSAVMKPSFSKELATTQPSIEQQLVSLNQILEKYAQSSDEVGNLQSISLYYFIDFLEKRKDHVQTMALMRFWAASEKYRKLAWRLGNGMVAGKLSPNPTEGSQIFTLDTHRRLQKEMAGIYNEFISSAAQDNDRVQLPVEIIESVARYINSKTLKELDHINNNSGLLRAQKYIRTKIEALFNLFCNSNAYFQLTSELQKAKLTQIEDPENHLQNNGNASITNMKELEESALMVAMSKLILKACGNITGAETENSPDDVDEPVLTLDNISLSFGNVVGPTKDDDEDTEDLEPIDHIVNTSKITELTQEMDKSFQQLDCLSKLKSKMMKSSQDFKNLNIEESDTLTKQLILDETVDLIGENIGDLTHQKSKLESQERRDAIVPGQCIAQIREHESDQLSSSGKKITFYAIDIVRSSGAGPGWSVERRYSDFDALHQKLKNEFEFVNHLELPGKTLKIWTTKSKDARLARLTALEKYLQVSYY